MLLPVTDSSMNQQCTLQGCTVTEAIDKFQPAQRAIDKPLRLPIRDVFRSQRGGTAVGGKLEAGALKPGTRVLVLPAGEPATVKAVEVDGAAADFARAGDSADVTLTGKLNGW